MELEAPGGRGRKSRSGKVQAGSAAQVAVGRDRKYSSSLAAVSSFFWPLSHTEKVKGEFPANAWKAGTLPPSLPPSLSSAASRPVLHHIQPWSAKSPASTSLKTGTARPRTYRSIDSPQECSAKIYGPMESGQEGSPLAANGHDGDKRFPCLACSPQLPKQAPL